MKEICKMALLGTFSKTNLPSISVITPIVLPLITTLAPVIGPKASSTVPLIVFPFCKTTTSSVLSILSVLPPIAKAGIAEIDKNRKDDFNSNPFWQRIRTLFFINLFF